MLKKISVVVLFMAMLLSEASCDEDHNAFHEPGQHYFKYLFFFGGTLFVVIIRYVVTRFEIPIPYAIFVMIIGICWGIAACYSNWMTNIMAVAHLSVLNIRYVYFPVIIFMTAFCLDVHAFFKSLPQILIISIPICFLSVSICGMLMRLVIDTKWSFIDALFFGAMSSCIYPLEVVRCLKETSIQTKHVTILLEGETLVSACLSLFFFRQLCMYYTSWAVHWYQIVMSLVREIFGGIFTGYLFGLFGVFMMKFSYNEATTLMLLTIVMCYSSYFFIDWFMKAGTVGCAVVGIMMGIERASLSKEIEKSVTGLWMVISYIMNGIFFLLIGAIAPTYLKNHFRFSDYILIFVNYLMANMTRFLSFFLFSPILSRLGYGMSFTNMVICVWGGLKNPISINQGLVLSQAQLLEGEELFKIRLFVMHNIALYILLIFINGSLVPTLLKVLGLSEISISRQFNMNNCMKYIYEARARTIAILKMDRFLSDANWPLVLHTTALKHPYKKTAAIGNIQNNEEEEEEHILGYRFTFCPDCQKEVLNEPTPKETKEMTKEAKLRILKLKKTSYSRQFENGMISKEGIRIMHQAVEIAMDSEDLVIELDGLFKLFDKEGCFYRCLRNRIQHLIKNKTDRIKPPRKPWRLWCYRVVTHNVFSICMNVVVLFNMIQVVYHVGTATKRKKFYMTYYLMVTCNLFFFTLYLIEFWLKVFAYSWIYICKHGIPTYFKSYWNILEFIILSYSFVCLVVNIVRWVITPLTELYYFDTTLNLLLALRICKVLTHCKFYDAWKALPAVILKYLNAKVDRHRALAYELGKSYIAGEEEILENIHQTVDNDKIREVIKTKIETDRLAVTKRLGIAQKESPCVATTVKTKLAMRTVLNSMKDDIYELKVSGWVDDVEYYKLLKSLLERYKHISTIKTILPTAPKLIFREVPYMGDNDELIEFLYSNVSTKKFDPGEVVYAEGELVEGIYILITGMFLVSYTPKEPVIDKLKDFGALPVVDYLCSPTYEEAMYEYVVPGNTIGELATLTERPYNGVITAETHSQVYIMNRDILKKAMEMDSDPVNGFECRIWKYIGFRKAVTVMMNAPAYRSSTKDKIKYVLERSFMPNLSNYKIFVVNEMMEDLILVEGLVVDFNTRDIYTGPCYIPRAVQKLLLPKSSFVNITVTTESKLMIIPARDFNEYEIMVNEEQICELVDYGSAKCLQHLIQERSSLTSKGSKGSRQKKLVLANITKQLKKKVLSGEISNKSRITFMSSKSSRGSTLQSTHSKINR